MADIKMRGPEDCGSTLSFGTETYSADKKGIFTVPFEAYEPLLRHGFKAVGDLPDEASTSP